MSCPNCGFEESAPPLARVASGIPEFSTEPHREVKPAVDSVDVEPVPVPAREDAKAKGTFGVDLPYEHRIR